MGSSCLVGLRRSLASASAVAVAGAVAGAGAVAVAVGGAIGGIVAGTFVKVFAVVALAGILVLFVVDTGTLGIAFGVALGTGIIVGFFFDNKSGIAARRSKGDLRIGAQAQATWLWLSWGLFLPLAVAAYLRGPPMAGINAKLDPLILFLSLVPLFLTGLPAWPLTAALALRQYRLLAGQDPAPERLARTIAFRWQSFAYPLPGLTAYLIRLGQDAGPAAALGAIQAVQFNTLQYAAARRAARELASDPATALPFCGTVAVKTNGVTLASLGRVGAAGHAVAALAPKRDQEDEEPLLLDSGGRPSQAEDSRPDLARIRERLLSERVDYAKQWLEELGEAPLVPGPPECRPGSR